MNRNEDDPRKRDPKNKSNGSEFNLNDLDPKAPNEDSEYDPIKGDSKKNPKRDRKPGKGDRMGRDKDPDDYGNWEENPVEGGRAWNDSPRGGKKGPYSGDDYDGGWGRPKGARKMPKIPEYKNRKHSVPKERVSMPSIEDIRRNPDQYQKGNDNFLNSDPEQSKLDEEQEKKELDDLFGDFGDDGADVDGDGDADADGDLGLGDIGGLSLLLDPSFLGEIQAMIQDMNESIKNFNRNKSTLKNYKDKIGHYKKKRSSCKDQYQRQKQQIQDKEAAKDALKKAIGDNENERDRLEKKIRSEEEAYIRGNQKSLKQERGKLENDIGDLEQIIRNEKPLLRELDNKRTQENDILERIKEIERLIREQEDKKRHAEGEIEKEVGQIKEQNKNMIFAAMRIKGIQKKLAVNQEQLKLREFLDNLKSNSMNLTEELNRIYQDKTISEEELQMILEEMNEYGDMGLDLKYKSDHEKFTELKGTLEELEKKALTMDFKGIEEDIKKFNKLLKKNRRVERTSKQAMGEAQARKEGYEVRIAKCERTLEGLRVELEKLKSQLAKCRSYIQTKTVELKNAKEMRDEKKKKQRELNKELQKLKNDQINRNNQLEDQKKDKMKNINQAKEQLAKERKDLRNLQRRVKSTYKDCLDFDKIIRELKKKAARLKNKLPIQKNTIRKLKKDIRLKLKAIAGMAI